MSDDPETDEGLTLPSGPESVAAARRYAMETCRTGGYRGDRDTLRLLVSEVATNALIHGAGQVRVRVYEHGPGCGSRSPTTATPCPPSARLASMTTGGRGLALVDALAAAWGADPEPGGKTVWFELA